MNTIRSVIFLVCLLPVFESVAQKGVALKSRDAARFAELYYLQEDYSYALRLFAPIHKTDSTNAYLAHRVGACLLHTRQDKPRAGRLLKQAVDAGRDEALFHYGWSLQLNYQFKEALEMFNKSGLSNSKEKDRKLLDRHISQCIIGARMQAAPVDVKIQNLGTPINTKDKEYVPMSTKDGNTLYFTSRRQGTTAQLKDPNGEYFEDIYTAQRDSVTGKWSDPAKMPVPINSETNDATVGLSSTGNSMLIFRTNENLTGGDLYITRKKDGVFQKPEKFGDGINTKNKESSACITMDGQLMIFSSNRPGGYGGMDLYVSRRLNTGFWSKALNLGPVVNSAGNEDSPYLSEDGRTLYFASDSHPGMGGYDLFKSTVGKDFVWNVPENMGYPINTPDDDVFLCMYAGGKKGYFSSDRPGGRGMQDIYAVEFVYRHKTELIAHGVVKDREGKPMTATITLLDDDRGIVCGTYNANARTGKFVLVVNPMVNYRVLVEAPGFVPMNSSFNLNGQFENLTEHDLDTYTMEGRP